MKMMKMAAFGALALAMSACGSKDPKEVEKVYENLDDLNEEQIATALDWYLEAQEERISELEDLIENYEKEYIDGHAASVGAHVWYMGKDDEDSDVGSSKAMKERRKQLEKNEEKIEDLRDKLKDLRDDMDDKYEFK